MRKKNLFGICIMLMLVLILEVVVALPEITSITLNATTSQNTTNDNLTAIVVFNASTTSINYNWLRNGTSITELNVPFTFNNTDNKTLDFSSFDRHGEVRNVTFNETAGIIGGAYNFDENGYIMFPQIMTGNNLTYGGWFKAESFTCVSGFCVIMQQSDAVDAGFEIYIASNGRISCWDGSFETTGVQTSLNRWYHVMCRHNGTGLAIFLNGTEQKSFATTKVAMVENFTVGGGVAQNLYWFNGTIDEVRVYNETLSDAEILNQFQLQYNKTIGQETNAGEYWNVTGVPINSSGINGSNITSSGMLLRVDNEFVCPSTTDCEYQDISTAVNNENTTDNVIRLFENNTEYQMPSLLGYDNLDINISASNITMDCNGTTFTDRTVGGFVMDTEKGMYNITVKNCVLNSMREGIRFTNVTLGEISNVNFTTVSFIGITLTTATNNITLFDLHFSNATVGSSRAFLLNGDTTNNNFSKISINSLFNVDLATTTNNFLRYFNLSNGANIELGGAGHNNTVLDVNMTNSTQLFTVSGDNNTLIRINITNSSGSTLSGDYGIFIDSFFEQIIINEAIDAGSGFGAMIRNNTFINNQDVGVLAGTNSTIINNTFRNNSVGITLINEANVTIINNSFLGAWDTNFLGLGVDGEIFSFSGAKNLSIINNYFNESTVTPILIIGAFGAAREINITNNTFANVPSANFSIELFDPNVISTNIWGNLFLSRNVSDGGTGTLFCVNGEGNFYQEDLVVNTNDCGQINITTPANGVFNNTSIINVNWTRQSAFNTVTYDVVINDTEGNETFISSSTDLNTSINTSLIPAGATYEMRIIPFVNGSRFNGTNNISGTFSLAAVGKFVFQTRVALNNSLWLLVFGLESGSLPDYNSSLCGDITEPITSFQNSSKIGAYALSYSGERSYLGNSEKSRFGIYNYPRRFFSGEFRILFEINTSLAANISNEMDLNISEILNRTGINENINSSTARIYRISRNGGIFNDSNICLEQAVIIN